MNMKRIWKRAAAFLMTMAMVLAMVLPVQATTGVTLSVNNPIDMVVTTSEMVTIRDIPDDADTITYKTYQVLYATYDSGTGELEYHLKDWAKAALVDAYFANETAAIEAITGLTTDGSSATEQADIVNILAAYIVDHSNTDEWTSTFSAASTTTATANLAVGSYLVVPSCSNMAFLNMLVSVSATADDNNTWEIAAQGAVLKGNTVSLTKDVKETDSTEVADGSTDAQIGEKVTYTITVDVPRFASDIANSDIMFKIVDVPQNVTIATKSVVVYGVNNSGSYPLDSITDYDVTWDTINEQLIIDLSINYQDVFNNNGTYPYTTVKVTYDAEVTSDALINSANENTATLYYGHDITRESDANSDEGQAQVYTYKLKITKVDTKQNTLSGASFEISLDGKAISFVAVDGQEGTYCVADSEDLAGTSATTTVTTASNGTITLLGLDSDKEYMAKETSAPAGYSINTNVIYFTLNAPDTLNGTISTVSSNEYTASDKETAVTTDKSWGGHCCI